jgi:Ran GTPase-activating protein (RanGAP) involved in mRNA processing and transport
MCLRDCFVGVELPSTFEDERYKGRVIQQPVEVRDFVRDHHTQMEESDALGVKNVDFHPVREHFHPSLERKQSLFRSGPDERPDEFVWRFFVFGSGRRLRMASKTLDGMVEWVDALMRQISVDNYVSGLEAISAKPDSNVRRQLDVSSEVVFKDSRITLAEMKALCKAVKSNMFLVSLTLSNLDLTDAFMHHISSLVEADQHLTHLSLSHNRIQCRGASTVAASLCMNVSLKSLDLSHNEIGDRGCTDIADLLLANIDIESLDVSENMIGVSGARALGDAIAAGARVEVLLLGRNRIGDEGTRSIAEALPNAHSLHTLDLHDNDIGPSGIVRMCAGLERNETLVALDLRGSAIDEGAATALSGCDGVRRLKSIKLGGEKLEARGVQALCGLLASTFTMPEFVLSVPYPVDGGKVLCAKSANIARF